MKNTLLKFDPIYNHVAVGIAIFDHQGVMIDCNIELINILGVIDKQRLIASKPCFYTNPNFSTNVIHELESGSGHSSVVDYYFDKIAEYRLPETTNQSRKILEISTSKLTDDIGEHIGYVFTYNDVTETKYKEKIQHAINNNITVGIELYDKNGKLVYMNPYGLKILGINSLADVSNINLFDSPNATKEIKSRTRDGEDFEYELEYNFELTNRHYFRTSLTGKRHLSVKNAAIRNERDQIEGYMLTFSDITHTRARQRLLEDTQSNLTLALHASNMSIWEYDIQSQRFNSIMGDSLPQGGLSLNKALRAVHGSDKQNLLTAINDIVSGEATNRDIIIRVYNSQTHSYRYFESQMSARFNSKGQQTHIIGTQHDITEKHLRNQYIVNARRSLDLALAASKIFAWDYDLQNNNLRILYGDTTYESKSLNIIDTINVHPKDRKRYQNFINDITSGLIDKDTIEVRQSDANGVYREYENTVASSRNEDGQITHLIGSSIDISERRAREKSERDLKIALEIMMDAGEVSIWRYDIAQRKFYAMLGNILMPDGTTYEQCAAAVAPDSLEIYHTVFDNLISGRSNKENAVFHFVDAEKETELYLKAELAILCNDQGERTTILGTQKDTTDDLVLKRQLEDFRIKTKLINDEDKIIQWDYNIEKQRIITHGNGAINQGMAMDHATYLSFIHPDDQPIASESLERMSRREMTSFDYTMRLRLPHHEDYRYALLKLLPIYDDNGTILSYTGIRRDVTEETLRNRELAEKTYKTELVTKASGIIPWEYDCLSQAFISEDSLLIEHEMSVENYVSTNNYEFTSQLEYIWNVLRERRDESFSIDIKYKIADQWQYATIAGEPYEWDSCGMVIRYLGYRNDTTDIEMMNESIRESQFKTEMAIQKANMVMWEYNVASQTFTAFNDPMTGYDAAKEHSPAEFISIQDPSVADETTAIIDFMNRQELGEFSANSKLMLPNSTNWRYVTIHGSHSEVSEQDPTKATKYIGFRVDNTELVKLSQGIEESNALTTCILDQSPSAVFIKDLSDKWQYIIANDMFCKLCDKEENMLVGYNDYEIFSKEVADKFRADDTKALEHDGVYSFIENFTSRGQCKALHTTKRVITLKDGRKLLIGIVSDITDTMAQQKELEVTKQKIELILNNANTGLVYIDNDFQVVWENVDSITDNPHTRKYKRGTTCYKELHGRSTPCSDCVILKIRESLLPEKVTKAFDDGTILEINATPVIGSDNQLNGCVCRIDNVTEDVMKTKKLEDTQKYLDLAIEAGQVSVWGYDLSTDEVFNISGRVFEQDRLPLSAAVSSVHPDDVADFITIWTRLITGESDRETTCLRFKNPFTHLYEYVDKSITTLRSPSGELQMLIGTHHDVTEDKRQKIIIEESNEKLNMALNVIQAFSWHIDMRDHVLLFDSNFISLGLDPEAMNSVDKFAERVHPDDKQEFTNSLNEFINDDKSEFTLTYRIDIKQNGNYEWFETRGKKRVMYENGQSYKYIYGMDCNVTHHKQITDQLTKAKTDSDNAFTLINNIIQQIPFGLFIKDIDDDMRYVIVNDKMAKYHNQSINDFIGRNDFEIMPYETFQRRYENHRITIDRNGEVYTRVFTDNDTDGTPHTWEVTEVLSATTDGRRLLIGLVADISDKELTRAELQRSKEEAEEANTLLYSIIKHIPFGLYIKDIDHEFRYIIMNDVLANIDMIDGKLAIGKTDHELFDTYRADMFLDESLISASKEDGEVTVIQHHIPRLDQICVYENSNTGITVANGRRLLIGVVADITEKERMLNEIHTAKNRAEQSDKLKSAFLANMSHEIRTPLNAIVGFSELLADIEDPADRIEYTKIISVNNELLLRLISDILDLSKIESGMIELKPEQFDLSDIFKEVYTMFQPKVINNGVDFIVSNPYHTCIVELDKNRLKQVLINYITNAVKYTTNGSITIGYQYINSGIEIYVQDTGIGIAKENFSKVFQRFEKLDSFAQGTGLGLSICKAITDAQNGEVGFEAEEGEGSRFWAWFPCAAEIEHEKSNNNATSIQNGNISSSAVKLNTTQFRILVAEDNDSNYLLIKHILKNHDVTRACNGVEAVEKAKVDEFDVILMDWKMPQMNGVEATTHIREFDKKIPIIAVTANAFDSDKALIIEAGCNTVVAKPINKQELLNAIEIYLLH